MSIYQAALDSLTASAGVRGAILANREDGIVVAESVMEDIDSDALAALASSLAGRLENAAVAANGGPTGFLALQASEGALFVAPVGQELLLILIADRGVNVGRARLEMARVAESIT